jgi:nicotinamidase-related amidase
MSAWFTPETAALLLIDYQVGVLQLVRNIPSDEALHNGCKLAKAAALLGMPIVMTSSQEDRIQGAVAPAMQAAAPNAFAARIKRAGIVNAWADPDFKRAVDATGRRQLIIGAITTDICLIFPAVSAVREGFEVLAVLDASGSPNDLAENMARRRMEREGVQLTATNTVIAELAQDWSRPEGMELTGIMFETLVPIQPVAP